MSSTKTYVAAKRGQLVTIPEGSFAPVWNSPERNGKTTTGEVIDGPATVGTATGNVFTDAELSWIEIVRAGGSIVLGVPIVSIIYLSAEFVKLGSNPDYDPSKDTGLPTTTTGTSTDPDPDTVQVSKKPGPGRVPVVASNGETVYVLVPAPSTPTIPTTPTTPTDNTKKYLTWGLYGILGLGVITLIVILIKSASKPKPSQVPKAGVKQ